MQPLRLCSWNVNGLRSLQPPLKVILDSLHADIICLQETKTARDLSSKWACIDGYNSYFHHCSMKSGYSGVAIFCRDPLKPITVTEGFAQTLAYAAHNNCSSTEPHETDTTTNSVAELSPKDIKTIDAEGRFIVTFFPPQSTRSLDNAQLKLDRPLAVISVYVPRVNPEEQKRVHFRSRFEQIFTLCVNKLLHHNHVVIAGDLNVYHTALDHCEPENIPLETQSLPCRQWLNSLLIPSMRDPKISSSQDHSLMTKFVDIFRRVHPSRPNGFTCWSARTGARETNYGVRLDYILLDEVLASLFERYAHMLNADHLSDYPGSDHCPIWTDLPLYLDVTSLNYPLPALCSRYWPQCQGKQVGLKEFLTAGALPIDRSSTTQKVEESERLLSSKVRNGRPKLKQTSLSIARCVSSKAEQVTATDTQEHTIADVNNQIAESVEDVEVVTLTQIVEQADAKKAKEAATAWQRLLTGPKKAPRCRGHNEACVLRSVKQTSTSSGSRRGRRFWACARPQGAKDNPAARCATFIWDDQYVP